MSDSAADGVLPGPRTPHRGGRGDAHPRPDRAQPAARPVPGGRERQQAPEGPLARGPGQRRAAGDVRPLVGAPADRPQPRSAPVPAAAPARAESVDGDRLRALAQGRRGGDRGRLPAARPRDVDPPCRPRGVQPAPRRRPARRPARGRLRRTRPDRDRGRDPARHHRPPQGRAPADARGGRRARGRRAGHGARPLARLVRAASWRTSTRSRRPRSTRSRSSPANSARFASRC